MDIISLQNDINTTTKVLKHKAVNLILEQLIVKAELQSC